MLELFFVPMFKRFSKILIKIEQMIE